MKTVMERGSEKIEGVSEKKHLLQSTRRLLATFAVAVICLADVNAFAGNGPGNAETDKINKQALAQLLENNAYHLKKSMLSYLELLETAQISKEVKTDSVARSFFERVGKARLREDILASAYTIKSDCRDKLQSNVSARAFIGELKGEICFDLEGFYEAHKHRSQEQRLIQLASLAFHEEVHHFQIDNPQKIHDNEDEAYDVSAYVLNTSIFVQMPVLRWSPKGATAIHGTGPIMESRFTGDQAHGLMRYMISTGGRDIGNTQTGARNITCQSATIVMMMMKNMKLGVAVDPNQKPEPPQIVPIPWVACSADPTVSPSALEGFIQSPAALVYAFSSAILMRVENQSYFHAEDLSCYTYSDRCMLKSREYKK